MQYTKSDNTLIMSVLFSAMLSGINSFAQKARSNQSLFRTPRSLSIESGLLSNSVIKSPPVQVLYFAPSIFIKGSYVLSRNWSAGVSFYYYHVLIDKLTPQGYLYPKGHLSGDIFARYFVFGRHVGLYLEAGPSFVTKRTRKQLDTFDYGGIFPFFKMSVGSMVKIHSGLYFNVNYGFAFSLEEGYRSRKGLNIGLAYYFNRYYSEREKPYKHKLPKEKSSPWYVSLGVGFYPLPA